MGPGSTAGTTDVCVHRRCHLRGPGSALRNDRMSCTMAFASVLARFRRRPAVAAEGSAASGQALGEVACLSPEATLSRLHCRAEGLSTAEAGERLATVGPNQVAHQAHHS